MENLFEARGGKLWAVLGKLAKKLPKRLIHDLDSDPGIIEAMVNAALVYTVTNPWAEDVDAQIERLRQMALARGWGFSDEVYERLASTAPAWPKGRHAFRSFRIRFGEGRSGVIETFEEHIKCIQHVYGDGNVDRAGSYGWLRTGYATYGRRKRFDCLRLFNGNNTHHACVEWVTLDLNAHRVGKSREVMRDESSLADELLVFVWMFFGMNRKPHKGFENWVAAGYEATAPYMVGEWQAGVCATVTADGRKVQLDHEFLTDREPGFSSAALIDPAPAKPQP